MLPHADRKVRAIRLEISLYAGNFQAQNLGAEHSLFDNRHRPCRHNDSNETLFVRRQLVGA